jgi:hypothetical protein
MKYKLSILLAITLLACNPVKLAFKEKHISQTKQEFFKRKLCVVDTIIDTVTCIDTFTITDTLKQTTVIHTGLKGIHLDTTVGNVRITIHNGVVTTFCPVKTKFIVKNNTITQKLRDKSYESVLENDIRLKDSTIKEQEFIIKDKSSDVKKLKAELYGLLLAIVLYVGFRLKKAFF